MFAYKYTVFYEVMLSSKNMYQSKRVHYGDGNIVEIVAKISYPRTVKKHCKGIHGVDCLFVFVGCLLAVSYVGIFSFITVPQCVIHSHQRVVNEGFEMQ